MPESVSALKASDAGQRSIEHLTGLWISCSANEEALRKETTAALRSGRPEDLVLLFRLGLKPVDSFSEPKAEALYQRYVKNHTWQTPTLVMIRALCSLDDPRFTADPRVKYLSGFVRSFWDLKSPLIQALVETMAGRKRIYERSLEEVGKMHRAGVALLAGTDTPFPFCFPGFSVHDELALLVEAGLTPMEALQTATRNPARYLDRLADLGTVEKGKFADLVLLDANPLDEIKNTQRIAAVIVRGKLLPQATLRKMLTDLEGYSSGTGDLPTRPSRAMPLQKPGRHLNSDPDSGRWRTPRAAIPRSGFRGTAHSIAPSWTARFSSGTPTRSTQRTPVHPVRFEYRPRQPSYPACRVLAHEITRARIRHFLATKPRKGRHRICFLLAESFTVATPDSRGRGVDSQGMPLGGVPGTSRLLMGMTRSAKESLAQARLRPGTSRPRSAAPCPRWADFNSVLPGMANQRSTAAACLPGFACETSGTRPRKSAATW